MQLLCANANTTGEIEAKEFSHRGDKRLYQVNFHGGTGQVRIKGRIHASFPEVVIIDISETDDLALPIQVFPEMWVEIVSVSEQITVGIDAK